MTTREAFQMTGPLSGDKDQHVVFKKFEHMVYYFFFVAMGFTLAMTIVFASLTSILFSRVSALQKYQKENEPLMSDLNEFVKGAEKFIESEEMDEEFQEIINTVLTVIVDTVVDTIKDQLSNPDEETEEEIDDVLGFIVDFLCEFEDEGCTDEERDVYMDGLREMLVNVWNEIFE